jgi:hypothetical protein
MRVQFLKRPLSPELRNYLLDLVREERTLEQLYRISHNQDQLRQIRAEWKASYRSIREALIAHERQCRPEPARQD